MIITLLHTSSFVTPYNEGFTEPSNKHLLCGKLKMFLWANMSQQEPLADRFLSPVSGSVSGLCTHTSSPCFISLCMLCCRFRICLSKWIMRQVCLASFAVLRDLTHLKHQGLRWVCNLFFLATGRNTGSVKNTQLIALLMLVSADSLD